MRHGVPRTEVEAHFKGETYPRSNDVCNISERKSREARAQYPLLRGGVVREGIPDGAEYEGRDQAEEEVAVSELPDCHRRSRIQKARGQRR